MFPDTHMLWWHNTLQDATTKFKFPRSFLIFSLGANLKTANISGYTVHFPCRKVSSMPNCLLVYTLHRCTLELPYSPLSRRLFHTMCYYFPPLAANWRPTLPWAFHRLVSFCKEVVAVRLLCDEQLWYGRAARHSLLHLWEKSLPPTLDQDTRHQPIPLSQCPVSVLERAQAHHPASCLNTSPHYIRSCRMDRFLFHSDLRQNARWPTVHLPSSLLKISI